MISSFKDLFFPGGLGSDIFGEAYSARIAFKDE